MAPRRYGRVVLSHEEPGDVSWQLRGLPTSAEFVVLHLLPEGTVEWTNRDPFFCHAGDGLLVRAMDPCRVLGGARERWIALLIPRIAIASSIGGFEGMRHVLSCTELQALASLASTILDTPEDAVGGEQRDLIGSALIEVAISALASDEVHGVRARSRQATLLDRAIALIGMPGEGAVDVERLARELGCSRSTLYRALAPAGGVRELIVQQRLAAAFHALSDPGDRRSIAVLADSLGFPDVPQFYRRFKRRYGITPGQHRAQRSR